MKVPRVSLFTVAVVCGGILSGCLSDASKSRGSVPEDWYRLPENGEAKNAGSLTQLGTTFEQFLEVQSESLETLEESEQPDSSAGQAHPKDWKPWHLAMISTDFSVTGEGVLGALLFNGTAAVQAIWQKPGTRAKAPQAKPQLKIAGRMTSQQLSARIEPAIQAALATGSIRNEGALRRNVVAAAERFRAMAWHLQEIRQLQTRFKPTTFSMEIGLGADGQVYEGIGVGASVLLHFDWVKKEEEEAQEIVPHSSFAVEASPTGKGIEAFVRAIAPALDEIAPNVKTTEESGFELYQIQIGVAASGDFDFGIARAGSSVMGILTLEPSTEEPRENVSDANTLAGHEEINLIDGASKTDELDFAVNSGLQFRYAPDVRGKLNSVVYRVARGKFRRGLQKAFKMSQFFTRRANSARLGAWKISEIKTHFDTSLSGTLGLATVGGVGQVELFFRNKRF